MINLFKPCMGEEELESLRSIFESGWIGLGPETEQFEKQFAEYIGCRYAVGLNSATAALDLSLKLLNINHGDEVIAPTITFVSTAHVVKYNLAEPIFADVDEDLLIDLEDVARKITKRTKAIIPVHYAGRPVDMDRLKEIAGDIPIIEDAAHAAGSVYKGDRCGGLGTMGAFSFHAVKNLAMGDGGAITTDDKEIYERAKKLRWLGIDKSTWDRNNENRSYWWEYSVSEIGLKCHMNDISATIGLCNLKNLDKRVRRTGCHAEIFNKKFDQGSFAYLPGPLDYVKRVLVQRSFEQGWAPFDLRCLESSYMFVLIDGLPVAPPGIHIKNKIY